MPEEESSAQPQSSELNRAVEIVLREINGTTIEQRLLDLARIGGEIKEVGKEVAVTRLAFSEDDIRARVLLQKQMEDTGMQVEQHPMGLIGVYPGQNPDLPAVALMSHFDSVPNGGMYDGTVGIVSSIEIVRLLHENGLRFPHSIMVFAVTAEESSRFNVALMGSNAIFQGLPTDKLDNRRPGDQSLREALIANGFNPEEVKKPRFKPEEISACVELHVSQNRSLEQRGKDLAVIEAIAAPDRRELTIGDPIEPDTQEPANAQYFAVSVKGRADHSGATSMSFDDRLDSLAGPTAAIVWGINQRLQKLSSEGEDTSVSIGALVIEDQALNKIPGHTKFNIRVGGDTHEQILRTIEIIQSVEPDLIRIEKLEQPPAEKFFRSEDIMPRQKFAMEVIRTVRDIAFQHQLGLDVNVVGTVGTYTLNDKGQITLGIDVRGTDVNERDYAMGRMLDQINGTIKKLNKGVNCSVRKLPGSSEPTQMDKSLVASAEEVIKENNLGSYETTFSPAGHDTQNAARIGIPTVMIFIPSRNNGASHTPQEYSTPEDLERGARALAALTMKLASES